MLYVPAYFYFYLMDEKLRPEEVRSFVHQRVSEHQGEGSMMTGAPCSLEPSSVDMNFLWAALKEGGHQCQFRHCQRLLAGECSFGPGRSVHSRAAGFRGQSNSDTLSDPAVILGRYRCSSHHGNVGSKTSQGTVTCPQTFDLLLIP